VGLLNGLVFRLRLSGAAFADFEYSTCMPVSRAQDVLAMALARCGLVRRFRRNV
jgi:hypothetical protein